MKYVVEVSTGKRKQDVKSGDESGRKCWELEDQKSCVLKKLFST